MSLQSMIDTAASALGDGPERNVPDAVEVLMAASETPRTPGIHDSYPASSSGARGRRQFERSIAWKDGQKSLTGGTWDTPAAGGLSNQASSMRAQAEGLRNEMRRFQSNRKTGPFS